MTEQEAKDWFGQCKELTKLLQKAEEDRDAARANARILAHAYATDNKPPAGVVHESLNYPVIAESITKRLWKRKGE